MSTEIPKREELAREYSNEELAGLLEEYRVELNELAERVDRGLLNEDVVLGEDETLGLKDAVEALDAVGFAVVARTEDVDVEE